MVMKKVSMLVKRDLDDYYYNYDTHEVIHIIKAVQPQNYKPGAHEIIYIAKSNKKNKILRISSKDKKFWVTFKKTPKIKAMLWW